MRTAWQILLLALLMLSVAFLATTQWAQGSTATEDWADLSDWTSSGCGIQDWQRQPDGTLHVVAYSCGLYYNQTFSRDVVVSIEGQVRCQPASYHNRCWAGIKIGNIAPFRPGGDDYPICEYGNENVAYHVWTSTIENVVGIVNCYAYYHGAYIPGTWATLKVLSEPAAGDYVYYSLYLNGVRRSLVRASLTGDLMPKIECVSAVASGPGDGSLAGCDFGPLTITVGSPPTPTPTPTPTPKPWYCKYWPQFCK